MPIGFYDYKTTHKDIIKTYGLFYYIFKVSKKDKKQFKENYERIQKFDHLRKTNFTK